MEQSSEKRLPLGALKAHEAEISSSDYSKEEVDQFLDQTWNFNEEKTRTITARTCRTMMLGGKYGACIHLFEPHNQLGFNSFLKMAHYFIESDARKAQIVKEISALNMMLINNQKIEKH